MVLIFGLSFSHNAVQLIDVYFHEHLSRIFVRFHRVRFYISSSGWKCQIMLLVNNLEISEVSQQNFVRCVSYQWHDPKYFNGSSYANNCNWRNLVSSWMFNSLRCTCIAACITSPLRMELQVKERESAQKLQRDEVAGTPWWPSKGLNNYYLYVWFLDWIQCKLIELLISRLFSANLNGKQITYQPLQL